MDNRTTIMNCALDLFASHGYEAVGVQEIVNTAGVTKPTLYHYFGSKQGLLEVILKEKYEPFINGLKEAAYYNGDLPTCLYKTVAYYFNYAMNNPEFYRSSIAMIFSPKESDTYKAIMPYLSIQNKILQDLFIIAAKDHGNMRGRHTAYATSLFGMINTYIQMWISEFTLLNEEVTFKAVHQFMHGIYS